MFKITYRSGDSVLLKTIERAAIAMPGQLILLLLLFDFFCLFIIGNNDVLAPTLYFFMVVLIICFFFLCVAYYPSVRTIINSLHPGPVKYTKGSNVPTFISSSRTTHYSFQNKTDKTRHQGYAWLSKSSNDTQSDSGSNSQINESNESSSDDVDKLIASLKERVANHDRE